MWILTVNGEGMGVWVNPLEKRKLMSKIFFPDNGE